MFFYFLSMALKPGKKLKLGRCKQNTNEFLLSATLCMNQITSYSLF